MLSLAVPEIDQSVRIYFWMSRSEVVFLQAVLDAYEGLGRVRTERHDDKDRSLLLIITTISQESIVRDFLRHFESEIEGQIEFV